MSPAADRGTLLTDPPLRCCQKSRLLHFFGERTSEGEYRESLQLREGTASRSEVLPGSKLGNDQHEGEEVPACLRWAVRAT
jgi:hypothetical protein